MSEYKNVVIYHLDGSYTKGYIVDMQTTLFGDVKWLRVEKNDGSTVDVNMEHVVKIINNADQNG